MGISSRKQAVESARSYHERDPVFLDTETTGIGPNAEIVEIAIVDNAGQTLFDSLVKPRGPIEPDAARVHKITASMVQDSPSWDVVWEQVRPVLSGRLVGIYNSEFDLRLMKQTHQRFWMQWDLPDEQFFCVMKLYAQFVGEWNHRHGNYRWHSLDSAGSQCKIALQNVHRALGDALLTQAVFSAMVNWQG